MPGKASERMRWSRAIWNRHSHRKVRRGAGQLQLRGTLHLCCFVVDPGQSISAIMLGGGVMGTVSIFDALYRQCLPIYVRVMHNAKNDHSRGKRSF